ncbi:MAG: CerR family C-terminal domain-containing protein [Desulfovibrio sp.]
MGKKTEPIYSNTKELLIHKGMELFALHGYTGVSLRQLASECEVNLAAVGYHFGSKEGLYIAIWDYVISRFDEEYSFRLTSLHDAAVAAGDDSKQLAEVTANLVRMLITFSLEVGRNNWVSQMLQWEAGHPTEAYDRVFGVIVEPTKDIASTLTGGAWGIDPESEECIIAGHGLLGLIFGFSSAHQAFLSHIGWDNLDPEKIEQIINVMTCMAQKSLGLPTSNNGVQSEI